MSFSRESEGEEEGGGRGGIAFHILNPILVKFVGVGILIVTT